MVKNKYTAWALAFAIAGIASGILPDPAKADGCVGDCKINSHPPRQPSCEATDNCQPDRRGSLYDEIYSKHKPYCGYLRRSGHHSPHWSERFEHQVGSQDSPSKTSWYGEQAVREDLIASTKRRGNFSASEDEISRNQYARSSTMGGESAVVLLIVILLWFGLRSLFGKKDSSKE